MTEEYLDCAVEVNPVEEDEETISADGRRVADRIAVDGVTTAVRQAGFYKLGPLHSVNVLDVGTGGISFESDQPISTGQKVELLIDTPVKNGIVAAGRVKYCIRWASNFRIGVEFVEIGPADQKVLTRQFFQLPH